MDFTNLFQAIWQNWVWTFCTIPCLEMLSRNMANVRNISYLKDCNLNFFRILPNPWWWNNEFQWSEQCIETIRMKHILLKMTRRVGNKCEKNISWDEIMADRDYLRTINSMWSSVLRSKHNALYALWNHTNVWNFQSISRFSVVKWEITPPVFCDVQNQSQSCNKHCRGNCGGMI